MQNLAYLRGNSFAATLMFKSSLWSWWNIHFSEFYDSVWAAQCPYHTLIYLLITLGEQACEMTEQEDFIHFLCVFLQ